MTSVKHFSTWADKVLHTYPIGPSEAEILSGFDEAMAKNGLGTRTRHMVIEEFLSQEVFKGRRYSFGEALQHLERPEKLGLTKEEVDTALSILKGEVADHE